MNGLCHLLEVIVLCVSSIEFAVLHMHTLCIQKFGCPQGRLPRSKHSNPVLRGYAHRTPACAIISLAMRLLALMRSPLNSRIQGTRVSRALMPPSRLLAWG